MLTTWQTVNGKNVFLLMKKKGDMHTGWGYYSCRE